LAPILTPRRIWVARGLAVLVDVAQLHPALEIPPINQAIDVATAIAMTWLVGWHWAFLPTFVVEVLPLVDLVPTWTIAVMVATRGGAAPSVTVAPPPPPGPPPAALPPGQARDGSGS
jgi:hypothetical protein